MPRTPRIRTSIRVDKDLTAARYADGTYRDRWKRSCVHQTGKEYLAGVDVEHRREEVWERDKECCVNCGVWVEWEDFEMDHVAPNYGARRWDNLNNLRTLCRNCHRGKGGKHA